MSLYRWLLYTMPEIGCSLLAQRSQHVDRTLGADQHGVVLDPQIHRHVPC